MSKTKEPKLIREIQAIVNNPAMHFWIKCKKLALIETCNRPASYKGEDLIREFFKTCAGKYQTRFDSAYVRPYCNAWEDDRRCYDYVRRMQLNDNLAAKIGRSPRGVDITNNHGSYARFSKHLKHKYPEAFEKFEEIKKVEHACYTATERTSDYAWQHIFGDMGRFPANFNSNCKITKSVKAERRNLKTAMEKAQGDYNKLKGLSMLPPRYLYNNVSLSELQNERKNHTYVVFKDRYYITTETVLHYDSSKVSHGLGRLKHTDRKIVIRNGKEVVFSKVLKTYSGNFVLNVIEEHLGLKLKKIDVCTELKPVQLNPKMEVVETAESGAPGFRTFQRLFAGTLYDYCVLRNGITYHGPSIERCVTGWKKKKALSKTGAKIINMKTCMNLGFCSAGVRSFCDSNGIDRHKDYTVEELKKIVRENISHNRCYYGHELKQIGVL